MKLTDWLENEMHEYIIFHSFFFASKPEDDDNNDDDDFPPFPSITNLSFCVLQGSYNGSHVIKTEEGLPIPLPGLKVRTFKFTLREMVFFPLTILITDGYKFWQLLGLEKWVKIQLGSRSRAAQSLKTNFCSLTSTSGWTGRAKQIWFGFKMGPENVNDFIGG